MATIDAARLLGVVLMTAPIAAFAQTETLDYFGSPFTSVSISGNSTVAAQDGIPTSNTGEIVLSAPLGDNLNNVAVNPESYTFDSSNRFGSFYLSSQSPFRNTPGNYASFSFSTNAAGVVTGWNIDVVGGIFVGTNSPSHASVTITNGGDTFSAGFSSPSCSAPNGGSCYQIRESTSSPGSFSSSGARAPEIDPRSAMSALTLLLGALAVLRGRRPGARRGGWVHANSLM
jgi:hypothetical protein